MRATRGDIIMAAATCKNRSTRKHRDLPSLTAKALPGRMQALPPVVVSGWPKVARAAAKAVPPPSTTLSLSVGVAIAAVGAAAAAALAPAMLRQLRVQLPLLLVHLALLHRSEGGHLFSSWAAFRAWPVFQYELRKLIGLEASSRCKPAAPTRGAGTATGGLSPRRHLQPCLACRRNPPLTRVPHPPPPSFDRPRTASTLSPTWTLAAPLLLAARSSVASCGPSPWAAGCAAAAAWAAGLRI